MGGPIGAKTLQNARGSSEGRRDVVLSLWSRREGRPPQCGELVAVGGSGGGVAVLGVTDRREGRCSLSDRAPLWTRGRRDMAGARPSARHAHRITRGEGASVRGEDCGGACRRACASSNRSVNSSTTTRCSGVSRRRALTCAKTQGSVVSTVRRVAVTGFGRGDNAMGADSGEKRERRTTTTGKPCRANSKRGHSRKATSNVVGWIHTAHEEKSFTRVRLTTPHTYVGRPTQ